MPRVCRRSLCVLSVILWWILAEGVMFAGGPRRVAGTSYFDPAVVGQPIRWASGQIGYFTDRGPLSDTVSNAQAVAMVDAAAAIWSAVPTAAVVLTNKGSLAEDVSGSNAVLGTQYLAQPSDVTPAATSTPIGVVFDADGSVIDRLFGSGMSDPSNCNRSGVEVLVDNIRTDATIAHALVLVNGLCTDTARRQQMLSYLLERAFGTVLGLGAAQYAPHALRDGNTAATYGWPVMQPQSGSCPASGGTCIPDAGTLRYDDIASLNRLYPVTSANLASFSGKELTAANTVSIQGNITFRAGSGMQGVNVVARPLDANGKTLDNYAVTFVSGAYFSGNHGNAVTGWNDTDGTPLAQWGSNDPAVQGSFDLRFMPLPPGATSASYLLTFESIDPLYIYDEAVGPYKQGSPDPSGTLAPLTVNNLAPSDRQDLAVSVADSAVGNYENAIATEAEPRMLSASGLWCGRLSQVGQTDWFTFPVRSNRTFTVVTEALNEQGLPSSHKAMPAIGIWDAFAAVGSTSVGKAPGLNGNSTGESWLRVTTSGDDVVRLGIADMRGDGRPEYAYNGWVLSIDSIAPPRLPLTGGPLVIRGMGFHPLDTVLINGKMAQVTSVSPNEITAIAPPASAGVTGSVDVEVDDLPVYYAAAVVYGGLSYDAGNGDSLTVVTAPSGTVAVGVPIPFTVTALGSDLKPAGGTTVTFTVSSGTATLGCGKGNCPVVTAGDGTASMSVTANDATASVVLAALTNGASLQAHFSGGTAPVLTALNPTLSVAAGVSMNWVAEALVLSNGRPTSGQSVAWKAGTGIQPADNSTVLTASTGVAAKALKVGVLNKGQLASTTACLNGTSQCVTYQALGARPEYAYVEAISGTVQSLSVSDSPALVSLRVRDMNGNPMAGGTVTLNQTVYAWAPPCPPQGRCAQTQLLAQRSSTSISGLDGTVTFAPASVPGVATDVVGVATTGDTSTLAIAIEQHP